jgi:urocanate hydratase
VHGTTITVLNAGRKYLGTSDLRGKVFVTSGLGIHISEISDNRRLGGMSGAQPKAGVICNTIAVVAEVNGIFIGNSLLRNRICVT